MSERCYLFLDTEYNDRLGTQRELGYRLIDENWNLVGEERKMELDERGMKGFIRQGKKSDIPFVKNYAEIKKVINDAEFVVGWSIECDVDQISRACNTAKKEYLDFAFFDLAGAFQAAFGLEKKCKLEEAVAYFGKQEFTYHDALEDAKAAEYVAKKLCEKTGKTFADFIKENPNCLGDVKKGKINWLRNSHRPTERDNRASLFALRVDFPVWENKKNIGPRNLAMNGKIVNDGVVIYYDYVLDECFYGKEHPGKITSKGAFPLKGNGIYNDPEIRSARRSCLKRFSDDFVSQAKGGENKVSPGIVSFNFALRVKNGVAKIETGMEALDELGKYSAYVSYMTDEQLRRARIMLRRLYGFDKLVSEFSKGKKFCYGEKEYADWTFDEKAEISYQDVAACGGELFLPRWFYYELTGESSNNKAVYCLDEFLPYAKGEEVKTLSAPLKEQGVKLVVVKEDGTAYAYTPCTVTLTFEDYENQTAALSFLLRRKVDISTLGV